ncbi:hypothetical protein [Roseovarius salinarum]|uniref:hypothetical protein n=1 Tax=Roseovarius salinarum TaxID=1981892 RepID=UPI000C33797F|nr:hypothetical protein [Roseovarius salinarum]
MSDLPTDIDPRALRRFKRARRARIAARLLAPVFLVMVSAVLWSDPVIGPKLRTGLANLQATLGTQRMASADPATAPAAGARTAGSSDTVAQDAPSAPPHRAAPRAPAAPSAGVPPSFTIDDSRGFKRVTVGQGTSGAAAGVRRLKLDSAAAGGGG